MGGACKRYATKDMNKNVHNSIACNNKKKKQLNVHQE